MKETDYLVIGGGLIGASIAYHLVKLGAEKVMVIDKNTFSSGSSGKCIGGVRQQFSDVITIKVMMESIKILKELQDTNWDIDFEQSGYLLLAYSKEEGEVFKKNIILQKKLGLEVDYIGPEEIKKIVPGINPEGILGGAYCELDGQVDPFKLNYQYLKKAEELGAEILLRTKVVEIKVEGDEVKSVLLDNGEEIKTKNLINAAGPWAKEVALRIGIKIPAEPERHEALVTEKVNRFFKPMLVDFTSEHGVYFQQKVNGSITSCFTPVAPLKGINCDSSPDFLSDISKRMIRLLPPLEDIHIVRQWAGCYIMSPDGKPIVGFSDKVKNFFVAAAFCGHGLMLSAAVGKLAAQLLLTRKSEIDIEEYSVNRFAQEKKLEKELLR